VGRASRLKRARREERLRAEQGIPTRQSESFQIIRSIHQTIQHHCGESSRRCWEYLLEMTAHQTGWHTETNESKALWDKMGDETRFVEFFEAWIAEVEHAKENRVAFSEPLGSLLEEINGNNKNLGQFFTPMQVVRAINEMTFHDLGEVDPSGRPKFRGLDPCCGTGRFMIDALVHNDSVFMHGIDLDLWALRTAMLNVRLLCKWTSMHVKDDADRLKDLPPEDRPEPGTTLIIGGRGIFIHGDALRVDLNYAPNWLCAGWAWSPRPWQSNLKIENYYGTYDQWQEAGFPLEANSKSEVQFDYSMAPP